MAKSSGPHHKMNETKGILNGFEDQVRSNNFNGLEDMELKIVGSPIW